MHHLNTIQKPDKRSYSAINDHCRIVIEDELKLAWFT